ncbi:unnamed protein product [Caenorhabditis bovis]|uniref:Uncharacterized protein n=1 Tax=Caenorhabditis bovis TaxID=2654633 RepID=A0A8S1ETW0_9PELO|nr:unnamed protein product [Caenorhabditis bovis]
MQFAPPNHPCRTLEIKQEMQFGEVPPNVIVDPITQEKIDHQRRKHHELILTTNPIQIVHDPKVFGPSKSLIQTERGLKTYDDVLKMNDIRPRPPKRYYPSCVADSEAYMPSKMPCHSVNWKRLLCNEPDTNAVYNSQNYNQTSNSNNNNNNNNNIFSPFINYTSETLPMNPDGDGTRFETPSRIDNTTFSFDDFNFPETSELAISANEDIFKTFEKLGAPDPPTSLFEDDEFAKMLSNS